jgi:hypothetical protein
MKASETYVIATIGSTTGNASFAEGGKEAFTMAWSSSKKLFAEGHGLR